MVYDITNFNSEFNKDFGLKEQIRRALVSIMSNIAEGFAKKTDKEFIRFLHIALGSTSEVQSQLYVAFINAIFQKRNSKNFMILPPIRLRL